MAEPVAVDGYVRTVRERAIGVWAGKYNPPDADGRITEAWVWLPKSQVKWVYLGTQREQRATIWMPEFLAKDRGLTWRDPNRPRENA